MHTTEHSSMLKNRRSSSLISQQLSKRSSVNVSSVNLLNGVDFEALGNVQMNNKRLQGLESQHGRQCQQTMAEQIIQRVKKQMIEPYRVVKKHVKENALMFDQTQLKQVYQGMSNSLKGLEKLLSKLLEVKSQQHQQVSPHPTILSDINNKQPTNCSVITSSFISSSIVGNDHHFFVGRVQQLQQEIQFIKQQHSKEIRLVMANHEEEMMFFQTEQEEKVKEVRKGMQRQMEMVIKECRRKEDDAGRVVNEQVRVKLQAAREQDAAMMDNIKQDHIKKEASYKEVVKKLIVKLDQMKNVHQTTITQHQSQTSKLHQVIKRLSISQQKLTSTNQAQFLTELSTKLQSLLTNSPQIPEHIANQYSTITIEQMFMNESGMSMLGDEGEMEKMMGKLVMWGFWGEGNEENVGRLVALVRQVGKGEEVLGHTVYPLIVEKIKLALAQYRSHQNDFPQANSSGNVSEFDAESLPRQHPAPSSHQVHYRNIDSIEQLQVSDSMIGDVDVDEDNFVMENNQTNYGQQIEGQHVMNREISYDGYESNSEGSASFDVEMF